MADEEKKITCTRCGYEANEKENHCIKCGAPLQNKCMDEPGNLHKGCGKKNEPNAAFCSSCGHPTLFHQHGLVTPHPSAGGGLHQLF